MPLPEEVPWDIAQTHHIVSKHVNTEAAQVVSQPWAGSKENVGTSFWQQSLRTPFA